MLKHFSLAALVAAGVASHAQAADACTLTGTYVRQVNYWTAPSTTDPNDYRCDRVLGGGAACRLGGWFIAPTSGGNFPTVIYEHGEDLTASHTTEEHSLSSVCEIANHLVADGYAVFVPYRRGVVDDTNPDLLPASAKASAGFFNTGMTTDDYADYWGGGVQSQITDLRQIYLGIQMETDFESVLSTLASLSRSGTLLVNTGRLAVMGHSYGGVATQIAAAATYSHGTPKAFVSLSGAALSWSSTPQWATLLDRNADAHRFPLYLQGVDGEAGDNNGNNQSWDYIDEVYSHAVGHGGAWKSVHWGRGDISDDRTQAECVADGHTNFGVCIHGDFVSKKPHVDHWYPTVQQFLAAHGV